MPSSGGLPNPEIQPRSPPGALPNSGIEPRSPTLQMDSLPPEPQGKPKNTGVGSLSLLQQIFPTQELNWVSYIAGGFFTNLAIREAHFNGVNALKMRKFAEPEQLPLFV